MTKKETLNYLMKELGKLSGKCINRKEALDKGEKYFIHLEYNSMYGGYLLVEEDVTLGSIFSVFNINSMGPRLNYKTIVIQLKGLIEGMKYIKNYNKS